MRDPFLDEQAEDAFEDEMLEERWLDFENLLLGEPEPEEDE